MADTRAVNMSAKGVMTGGVVTLGPFRFEQRLGSAIPALLPPVLANRIAAVMPDHGSGTESQGPSLLLNPPTEIDVIASGAVFAIEAAHSLDRAPPECHVAAGNM